MGKTQIEWTDATWNPVTGCTKVSPGCKNCYAERMARRLAGRCGYPETPHAFDVTLHYDRLGQPLSWRKPRMIFLPSMGDLFHEDIPLDYIADVFNIMAQCQQHTFQILTKRPVRARAVISDLHEWNYADTTWTGIFPSSMTGAPFPLPNVWLGVSVENQWTADERIPLLLQIPAAVRFASCEPLLGPVDIAEYLSPWLCTEAGNREYSQGYRPSLHWVIVGGETGPGARPMHPGWARNIRDQCQAAGTAFFFKQWGEWAHVPADTRHPLPQNLHWWPDRNLMGRVGKKAAGSLLDGVQHNEYPQRA